MTGHILYPSEITDQVKRWASLGRETFEEKIGECTWEVALLIPYKVGDVFRSLSAQSGKRFVSAGWEVLRDITCANPGNLWLF